MSNVTRKRFVCKDQSSFKAWLYALTGSWKRWRRFTAASARVRKYLIKYFRIRADAADQLLQGPEIGPTTCRFAVHQVTPQGTFVVVPGVKTCDSMIIVPWLHCCYGWALRVALAGREQEVTRILLTAG